MSAPPLDLTELDDWLANLAETDGIASAARTTRDLNTPGILVRIMDIRIDTLAQSEWRLDLDVRLVVGDENPEDAQDSLVALLNVARPLFGNPPGSFTPTTVDMPDASRRPALSFSHTLTITE